MDCERRVGGSYDAAMGTCPQLRAGIPQACVQASDPGGPGRMLASQRTPLVLYTNRPLPPPWGHWGNAGRGRGRGRGKGGGKAAARAKLSRAPNDKPICFRYNNKAGCKKKDKCHFMHVCSLCSAKHPSYQCPTVQS